MAANFSVGVSILMQNGVSSVFNTIGRDMLGLQKNIRRIEGNFGGWSRAIAGTAGLLGGAGILGAPAKIANHGDKVLDQQSQLRNLGIEQNDILKVTANFYDNIAKKIPTANAAEYLKTMKEMRSGHWPRPRRTGGSGEIGSERAHGRRAALHRLRRG
jgi:hypothetical protein